MQLVQFLNHTIETHDLFSPEELLEDQKSHKISLFNSRPSLPHSFSKEMDQDYNPYYQRTEEWQQNNAHKNNRLNP